MRTTTTTIALFALAAAPTYADITWSAAERLVFAGGDSDSSNGASSGMINAYYMIESPAGDSVTKAENEFRIENDIYSSLSFFSIGTLDPNADLPDAQASMSSSATLSLTETTTFRIDHEIVGAFDQRDEFQIQLINLLDDSIAFSLQSLPATNFSIITLEAGDYTFSESYSLNGILSSDVNRDFKANVAFTVVPAPASLALIAPAGLLATRRRRA